MVRRDGSSTLVSIAQRMCKAIVFFQPTLEKFAEDKPAVRAALVAALTACAVLEQTLRDEFFVEGD